jgi:hypothetical protein
LQDRIEIRDSKSFVVKVLPDDVPNPDRRQTTHYHLRDVEKPGNLTPLAPRKRRRRKKKPG